MIDFDVIAYGTFGLSVAVSAVQVGRWILNANPKAVVEAGRWSLAALAVLTPLLLLWLIISGRSTLAMMLAAFILPVFVQGGLRWRALFGPLHFMRNNIPRWVPHFSTGVVSGHSVVSGPTDPDLVRQSIAVLSAYLDEARRQADCQLTGTHLSGGSINGSGYGSGRRRMSIEEALEVLGLELDASPHQISEAHARLEQKLNPELGGTYYLVMKINEARNVLLEG